MNMKYSIATLLAVMFLLPLAGCKNDTKAQRVVNVYSWSEYLPQEIQDKFTAKTGIKIKLTVYENNEALVDKLQAGVSDFDLVVPSDYTVALLKRRNLLQKIDASKIANWKNLDPRLLGREYDPKNEYSIPCFWGTTGIGYNKKTMGTVDSWRVMFDEKNAGKILMLKDSRECMAAALKLMGKSINEKDPAVLRQAGEMLAAQKKLVKTYNSDDFDQTLGRGDVQLAQGYNGQFARLVASDRAKFTYVVPKEGGTMWIDSFCIPAKARHAAEAHELLNFLLDPEIGAELVNKVSYASGNTAARAGIRPEILNDPAIYPPDEVIKRCEVMADLGDETMDVIDKIWEKVMVK
jgi:spermidine/putrescine transport system substrate-binding protein